MIKIIRKSGIISLYLLFLFALLLPGCRIQTTKKGSDDKVIGVKIYACEGDVSTLFHKWNDLGINTVFTSVSLLSNPEFRKLARKNNITTFVIIPVFFDPEALREDPDLYSITDRGTKAIDDWVHFVCPSRKEFREQKIEEIKGVIRDIDPDGVSIDFIRHFVYWEKVYPGTDPDSLLNTCFDPSCISRFCQDAQITVPESLSLPVEIAAWIKKDHFEEWTEWKCDLITEMIREITKEARKLKPTIAINVHLVPWRKNDFNGAIRFVVGQDIPEIAKYTDYLSPMTYAHMVKQAPSWIHSVVKDASERTGGCVIPSIQVKEAYLKDTLTLREFKLSLEEALKPPSHGVVFWSWETLDQDQGKKDCVKTILND